MIRSAHGETVVSLPYLCCEVRHHAPSAHCRIERRATTRADLPEELLFRSTYGRGSDLEFDNFLRGLNEYL